jgi:small subunit ribosomal protein S17
MNTRRRLTGVVASNKMMKTIIVEISRSYRHPLYEKVVHSSKKFKVHDEMNCKVGDEVQIVECKPISKQKHWIVEKILKSQEVTEEVSAVEEV